jgi:hypothetical protein
MFRTLYQNRAGYKTNCAACHQPQDRRLTPYGREFFRLGYNASALEALDVMDPDQDSASSQREIAARANPGDARSTPEHPGDWLASLEPSQPPSKLLSDLFGNNVDYEIKESVLPPAQAMEAEHFLGDKLPDADLYPTVVIVRQRSDARILGRAGYAYFSDGGLNVFWVALGPDAVIKAVQAVRVYGDQRFSGQKYLRQFSGKTYATLQNIAPPRGAETRHAAVLSAVKRAMRVTEAAVPSEK